MVKCNPGRLHGNLARCALGNVEAKTIRQEKLNTEDFWSVTTPDPKGSAKVSRYKREPYHEEGILLQKYRDRIGRCIAILFHSIGSGVDVTLLKKVATATVTVEMVL